MGKIIKLIMFGCTLLCAFFFIDVLLDDDDSTTNTEEVDDEADDDDDTSAQDDDKDEKDDKDGKEVVKPQFKKKIKAINNSTFKTKIADFSSSKTSCEKKVNAVVVLYSEKYDLSTKMISEMKDIINDYDFKFYSLSLEDGLDVVKAYGLTDVPTVIVATKGKIFTKKGYLSSSDLGRYLKSLE